MTGVTGAIGASGENEGVGSRARKSRMLMVRIL